MAYNLSQMHHRVKLLTDAQLEAAVLNPGDIPSFLALTEIKNRADRRAEKTAETTAPSSVVKDLTGQEVSPSSPSETAGASGTPSATSTAAVPATSSPSSPMMAGAPAASTPNMAAPPATGTAQQLMAGAPTPASQGIATLRKGGVVRMFDIGEVPPATSTTAEGGSRPGWGESTGEGDVPALIHPRWTIPKETRRALNDAMLADRQLIGRAAAVERNAAEAKADQVRVANQEKVTAERNAITAQRAAAQQMAVAMANAQLNPDLVPPPAGAPALYSGPAAERRTGISVPTPETMPPLVDSPYPPPNTTAPTTTPTTTPTAALAAAPAAGRPNRTPTLYRPVVTDEAGNEIRSPAVSTAHSAVGSGGPPAGGGGGAGGGAPAGYGGAGGGGAGGGYGGAPAGYGGAPAGGGGPQSPGAALVTAAANAAQAKYDAALKDSKPDVKQRKEDAKAMFLADLGFRLMANKSSKGLAGLGNAFGEAGAPALKEWEVSNKSLREDMRNYAKDTLAGLKDDLAARVAAGTMTQDHANKLLADATQRLDIATRAASSARSDASAVERLRISEAAINARATTAANRDALSAATTDLRQAQAYERDLLKQQAELRNESITTKPVGTWLSAPDPGKMALFNSYIMRRDALAAQLLEASAARAAAQKNLNARARLTDTPPAAGGVDFNFVDGRTVPAR